MFYVFWSLKWWCLDCLNVLFVFMDGVSLLVFSATLVGLAEYIVLVGIVSAGFTSEFESFDISESFNMFPGDILPSKFSLSIRIPSF